MLVLGLFSAFSHGEDALHEPDCVDGDDVVLQSEAERRRALAELERLPAACRGFAGWHARRGALLLALGQPGRAAESLERALLFRPDYPAASMDYAEALAAMGDLDAARQLAQALLQRDDVPVRARMHLEARLTEWRDPGLAWRFSGRFGARLGWESNLNAGPVDDRFELTLPQGVLQVLLGEGDLPREGWASIYDASVTGLRRRGDVQWLVRTQLRLREAASDDADYLVSQTDVGALRTLLDAEQEPTGDDPGAQVDKAAELQAKWGVKTGDLWGMGKYTKCPKCGKRHDLP